MYTALIFSCPWLKNILITLKNPRCIFAQHMCQWGSPNTVCEKEISKSCSEEDGNRAGEEWWARNLMFGHSNTSLYSLFCSSLPFWLQEVGCASADMLLGTGEWPWTYCLRRLWTDLISGFNSVLELKQKLFQFRSWNLIRSQGRLGSWTELENQGSNSPSAMKASWVTLG